MIEVELKFELHREPSGNLADWLNSLAFTGMKRSLDVYYDKEALDLLKQAVFVRVRNSSMLEFKFNDQGDREHVQCDERSFTLPLNEQRASEMNGLFKRFLPNWLAQTSFERARVTNGLIKLARIDKIRRSYLAGEVGVSVDQVDGIGNYLEIEASCEEGAATEETLAKLRALGSQFNLNAVKVGYVELWLLKHNSRAYRAGRYQLS